MRSGAWAGSSSRASGSTLLKAFAPGDIPRLHEVTINAPTALFTSVVLVVVTFIVGFAPALAAVRMKAFDGSIPTGRSSDGRAAIRLRDTLTVMEIAVAASLLVCTGLTVRTLHALVRVDLGFATEHRFAFKTNLTERDYPDAARVERFYEQLTAKLESLPGTLSIGAISYLPLSGEGHAISAAPADASGERDAAQLTVGWGIVRGRYFETMGVRLLRGRLFSTTIVRPPRPSPSWTTCWRSGCGRTRRRRLASGSGLAPDHRRRRYPWSAWSAASATSGPAGSRFRWRMRLRRRSTSAACTA